ncbi:sugar phosphate isomerase/epimerase family protein [Rathayibacter sp. CAU 1779]
MPADADGHLDDRHREPDWNPAWLVFTKPWPRLDGAQLGSLVASLGFDAIELPVRDGFQVEPASVASLSGFGGILADSGVGIRSVAAEPTRGVVEACAEAGVGMIRIMGEIGPSGYAAGEDRLRALLDGILPALEEFDVAIGIQPHHGRYISTAAGLRRVIEDYPPNRVTAVWDAAHNALSGEDVDLSLEQLDGRLGLINLKDATYDSVPAPSGSGRNQVTRTRFVPGGQGMADWPATFSALERLGYRGDVCLTAQYDDLDRPLADVLREDLRRARSAVAAQTAN